MSFQLCKTGTCNYVYPILEGDSIGNSLSTINLNFRSLDISVCSIENDINTVYNDAITLYGGLSSKWQSAFNTLKTLSSCWEESYNTVAEMSGFWLTPIGVVYPYPFDNNGTDITTISNWLNENFSPKNGTCFNFVVGQEVYVFSPENSKITRTATNTSNTGIKIIDVPYTYTCGGQKKSVTIQTKVDASTINSTVSLEDVYLNKFVCVKFSLNTDLSWSNGTIIFE